MNYPISRRIIVPLIFKDQEVELTFYSGLTTFVGPNGSGKTQTMKALKNRRIPDYNIKLTDKEHQIYVEFKRKNVFYN